MKQGYALIFHTMSDSHYETELTGQPRPNVLFEAGMALVTHPDQTILLQIGKIRPFSDVAGRHIVSMDNSTTARQELASRLEDAGCPVNWRGKDWHTSGDLTPPQIMAAIQKQNTGEGASEKCVATEDDSIRARLIGKKGSA